MMHWCSGVRKCVLVSKFQKKKKILRGSYETVKENVVAVKTPQYGRCLLKEATHTEQEQVQERSCLLQSGRIEWAGLPNPTGAQVIPSQVSDVVHGAFGGYPPGVGPTLAQQYLTRSPFLSIRRDCLFHVFAYWK